jgi:hypothetical protein
LAYQPPASSNFLSEQISHQQSASSTFLSEQISTSHQPPAKRTGCKSVVFAVDLPHIYLKTNWFANQYSMQLSITDKRS